MLQQIMELVQLYEIGARAELHSRGKIGIIDMIEQLGVDSPEFCQAPVEGREDENWLKMAPGDCRAHGGLHREALDRMGYQTAMLAI